MSIGAFELSRQWLLKFCQRKGIQSMILHGEENPEHLQALSELYAKISKFEPENVYNMNETGLFF